MYKRVDTQQANFERYRISVIEARPESAWKDSALASAHAALERELNYEREFRGRTNTFVR